MDKKTVFVKTAKGEDEAGGSSDALYGDAKRIFVLVDDESTVGEITKRAPPSLRDSIQDVLQELLDGGYIRDMREPENAPQKSTLKFAAPAFKMSSPAAVTPAPKAAPNPVISPKISPANIKSDVVAKPMTMPDMSAPAMSPADKKRDESIKEEKNSDLDFSFITSASGQGNVAAKVVNEKAQADAALRTKQQSERLKAEQSAQIEATARAAKLKAYEEAKSRAKADVDTKGRIEAEIRIKKEAEAKVEAEMRAKKEAEAARTRAEQDASKARQELEATKARVEAEVRARLEAELKVKREADAARLKAEREAEKIRLELEAAKAKAEQEIKIRLEAEARARAEVEARLKREADAERLRIEKERAELELARIKAEAEIRMRTEAELRVRAEIEARLQAEALEQQRQLLSSSQGTLSGAGKEAVKNEQADPAEKLRQSFVKSFGEAKKKQDSGTTTNFKLEKFSLVNTGKIAALIAEPKKPDALPGAGSKVKAAIAERARKEAEAQRIMAEQDAARIRAEQDAAVRSKSQENARSISPQEAAAARNKQDQDLARLKAEQETYLKKVAQDEEQAKADVEAKKLSEQQGKQWEEAQKKAAILEKAERTRLEKQAAEQNKIAKQKIRRAPRKPLPIGKVLLGILVLVVIAVFALPYVWPLDDYIVPLEKELSAQINQPVKIKKINIALLPLPRLELHNLAIGSGKELKVGDVVLNFDLSALFASTKSISKLELKDVTVSGKSLDKVLVWLQTAGGIEKYPVARIDLSRVEMISADIKLPLLGGRADFDPQGKFTKASLSSEDSRFSIELQSIQNRMQLELNMHDSSLPVFTDIKFKDLSATGIAENGEIVFSEVFAHVYGGTLTGKGNLNWNNGWKLQGQINAKSLELKDLFPAYGVTGQVYGDVNVSMSGATVPQLDDDPRMEGSFEAKNGEIKKLDIDTVARFGSRQGLAGRTSFTELTGTFKSDSRGQRFFISKMNAGDVSASGQFEISGKDKLAGKLMVDIKGVTSVAVPLQLGGSPADPALQQGR